ncbi:LSM-domain-containing protein [Trichodelitschia bisporula]|uniref:Sm protein F n=1 Tax=Trichodelitschia bisporula TaxID=703511 RepID=A0A6G1HZH3_9PEZI|nr:LSM-domain-containing protein [Trichodelitschia bisporula]
MVCAPNPASPGTSIFHPDHTRQAYAELAQTTALQRATKSISVVTASPSTSIHISPIKMSAAFIPLNPRPMLQALVNENVIVRLKWAQTEYHGRLVSIDSYMNIQLRGTEEFIDGQSKGTLGEVLIRCNNVLWISGADKKDTEMTG